VGMAPHPFVELRDAGSIVARSAGGQGLIKEFFCVGKCAHEVPSDIYPRPEARSVFWHTSSVQDPRATRDSRVVYVPIPDIASIISKYEPHLSNRVDVVGTGQLGPRPPIASG